MPNETIEAAWEDLCSRVAPALGEPILELLKRAFYAGSYTTASRIMAAAQLGPEQFTETIQDIQAEFAEHHQRMNDKQR